MRRAVLLAVHASLAFLTDAHPAVASYHTSRSLAGRQDLPSAPNSQPSPTYDYWWPYPPWGATLTTVGPVAATEISYTSVTASPTYLAALTNTAPLSASSIESSTTSNSSMTTIAALPPATTPGRRYQRRINTFHPAYLAPVFAVVGVIIGTIFALLSLCIFRKCRGPRNKPLTSGVPYPAPSETREVYDGDNTVETELPGSESHFLCVTVPENDIARSGGVRRQQSWLQRAFTSHRREPARGRADSAVHAVQRAGASYNGEDDPFLVPPTTFQTPGRMRSPLNERDLEPARTIFERASQSSQDLVEDEELDNAPFNTLRHKSIRRDIIGRLKHGSRYRKGHKKADSDVNIEDLRASDGGSILTMAFHSPSPSQGRSLSHEPSGSLSLPASAKSPNGPGFMIIEEDPEADERGESSRSRGWSLPWTSSPDKLQASDTFTALPRRLRSPDRRNSPRVASLIQSPTSPIRAQTPTFHLSRVDSAVLPTSPPRVTSPLLDSQLFFGSAPNFGSGPELDLALPNDKKNDILSVTEHTSDRKQHRNKLHTRRSPPLLPFPSSPQFAQDVHLMRTPSPKKMKARGTLQRSRESRSRPGSNASTPSVGSRARSPAQRFAHRQGALDKVDSILAKSWSVRDIGGEGHLASPTMFGAVSSSQSESVPSEEGIEQRLLHTKG